MKSRKTFLIAIAVALLIGTTVTHAQSPSTHQEPVARLHDGTKYVTRDDGIYIPCTTCGFVEQITERNDVPNAGGIGGVVESLKVKATGTPQTHKDVDLILAPVGQVSKGVAQRGQHVVGAALTFPYGLDQTHLTVRSPQIQLHIGDLVYVDSNGDVRLLK